MDGDTDRVARPAPAERPPGLALTRRGALVLGGGGVVAVTGLGLGLRALGGPSAVVDAVDAPGDPALPGVGPSCVSAAALTRTGQLRGVPLVYDVSGDRTSFRFEPTFLARLEAWLPHHAAGSGLGMPAEVWSLGSWVAGDPLGSGEGQDGTVDSATGCRSWHNAGRAVDLTRLVDATGTVVVSFREDLWAQLPSAQMEAQRRRYWRAVAGLHRDFDSVLTYLFNDLHRSHVHVDDGRVGPTGGSEFRSRSSAQVQAVQAMCTWVWDRPVERTGRWDGVTRVATREVLTQAGRGGSLTDGPTAWHGFLDATLGREVSPGA